MKDKTDTRRMIKDEFESGDYEMCVMYVPHG